MDLLKRVRDRKIVQWAVVYLAGSRLFLEALGFVAGTFSWPSSVVRSAILLAAVGLFAVLVLASYHGEKGQQRAGGLDVALLAALAIVAGILLLVFGREPEPRAVPAASHVPTAASGPPAVAVVPFTVRGADMEFIGERSDPLAHLYLGMAYEALGRDAEARDAYRYFLIWWSEADAELQPFVDEARERLTRIATRLN